MTVHLSYTAACLIVGLALFLTITIVKIALFLGRRNKINHTEYEQTPENFPFKRYD